MRKYDRETDYQALIEQAAARGDYQQAARLEQQRNEKIRSEGLHYKQTGDYAGWLDTRDYGSEIRQAIAQGGDKQQVADLLEQRMDKASSTVGMDKWVRDDIYDEAIDYLVGGKTQEPVYESKYGDVIEEWMEEILSRDPFSYDHERDPLYQAYAQAYQREGKRATADVLGQAAQNTGGYASSYAISAAQQAGSAYSAKQADKIPELYELAWEVYQQAGQDQLDKLDSLTGLEDREYQKYRDRISDLQKQEELAYKKYMDALQQTQKAEQLAYDRQRDELADLRYDTEWQYELDRDALSDTRYEAQQAAKAAKSTGSGKKTSSASAKAEEEAPETGSLRIYGITGTFTPAEAEALVLTGMVEKIERSYGTFYKLTAMD